MQFKVDMLTYNLLLGALILGASALIFEFLLKRKAPQSGSPSENAMLEKMTEESGIQV